MAAGVAAVLVHQVAGADDGCGVGSAAGLRAAGQCAGRCVAAPALPAALADTVGCLRRSCRSCHSSRPALARRWHPRRPSSSERCRQCCRGSASAGWWCWWPACCSGSPGRRRCWGVAPLAPSGSPAPRLAGSCGSLLLTHRVALIGARRQAGGVEADGDRRAAARRRVAGGRRHAQPRHVSRVVAGRGLDSLHSTH